MMIFLLAGLLVLPVMELDPSDLVRKAIDKFAEASATADVAALDALLADPYLHVDGATGQVLGQEEWLEQVATRRAAIDAGTLEIDQYQVGDVTIRMRRDSALVTGVVHASGIEAGKPFDRRVRFSEVWVREGQLWKRALFHDSALPES